MQKLQCRVRHYLKEPVREQLVFITMCVSRNNLSRASRVCMSGAVHCVAYDWLERKRKRKRECICTALSPNLISISTSRELGHALFAPCSLNTISLLYCFLSLLFLSHPLCPPPIKEPLWRSHTRRDSYVDRYSHPAANIKVRSRRIVISI